MREIEKRVINGERVSYVKYAKQIRQKSCSFGHCAKEDLLEKDKPLRLLFLTSIRDVGTCDQNGRIVQTLNGPRYMEGVIEKAVREAFPKGELCGIAQVVGIITDDTEKDMKRSDYPAVPCLGNPWIFPLDMKNEEGVLLRDITFHVPSLFRTLPVRDLENRFLLKKQFETEVLEKMRQLKADVLVSDHYMAKIEFLFPDLLGLEFGRLLNIHPAVTIREHPFCFRGPTPTADAIERARTSVEKVKTGATLHIINEVIDDGPAVAYCAATSVNNKDKEQWLRYRNYQAAKLPIFISGLAYYRRYIFPDLGAIDFSYQIQ